MEDDNNRAVMKRAHGDSGVKRQGKKSMTGMCVVFALGIIVGVIGLCVALKVIFYIGMAVCVLAVIALIWAVVKLRNDYRHDTEHTENS